MKTFNAETADDCGSMMISVLLFVPSWHLPIASYVKAVQTSRAAQSAAHSMLDLKINCVILHKMLFTVSKVTFVFTNLFILQMSVVSSRYKKIDEI